MSTLRLSIVSATILAATIFTFAQTAGGPPAACPDPSQRPCSHCAEDIAEDIERETGMLALAGPDAVRHAYVHSARPPIAWVVGVMALFWPWALLAALGK